EKPASWLTAVVTGGVVSAVFAVPSVVAACANIMSVAKGASAPPKSALRVGWNWGVTLPVEKPGWPDKTGVLSMSFSYLSVLLTLQPAKPAAVAAMARLRRVFFTILLPVYVFLWLLVHFRDARRTNPPKR